MRSWSVNKHSESDPESVIACYDLNPDALEALKCIQIMERLTRKIRLSLKGEGGQEHGCPDAERLIVIASKVLRAEIDKRWKLSGEEKYRKRRMPSEPESVSITPSKPVADPFNW